MRKIKMGVLIIGLSFMARVVLAQDFIWEEISRENLNLQALLVNSQDGKIIFAGQSGNIFKSENSGKSWRRVFSIRGQRRNINVLSADKNNSKIIYAATDNGVYRSNDSGQKWERIFQGKNDQENQCIAMGISAKAIFAGTKAGLFISRDNGRSWYRQEAGIGKIGIFNIDTVFSDNEIIYLAAASGIFKSNDYGQNWERIFVSSAGQEPEADVVIEESESVGEKFGIRFVGSDRKNINLLYFSSSKGMYKSLNQGKSWEKLTEYGLLNSDIKMFCLTDNSQVIALTESGIFLYSDQRWLEISFGLASSNLNYLVLDDSNNIYACCKEGIFKSNSTNLGNFTGSTLFEEYLRSEPNIRDVQEAAIRYAEVSPEKITQWRKDAAKKAFLPQVNLGLERNSTDLWHWEGGSTTKSDDDVLHRGRDNIDWDISLTWDLSDLIWNDAQTSIDVRSKLLVELRDDILDQVNKLYFERLRVRSELDNLALEDRNKRFQKQLKLEELTASLDSLTCGYYSAQLKALKLN
ncbi:MAG TPA: hypothetical protein PL125_04360 [Candidatus Omnitrophota bacterium]|nr:hypothetical protein [Candidatus Omnitrophota bacterium]HPT39412.1 hypothetical protein [Candidatus Omnitrophota bacterium]